MTIQHRCGTDSFMQVFDSVDDIYQTVYQNSIFFDRRLYTDSNQPVKYMIPEFIEDNSTFLGIEDGYKTEAKKKAANNIISNLMLAGNCNKHVAVSLDSKHYSNSSFYGHDYYSYTIYKALVTKMEEYGLIEITPGYYNTSTKEGKRSRISPTDSLIYEIGSMSYSDYEYYKSDYTDGYFIGEEGNPFRRLKHNRNIILKDSNKNLMKYTSPNCPRDINIESKYNSVLTHNIEILLPANLLPEEANRRRGRSAQSISLWGEKDMHLTPIITITHKNCSNPLLYLRLDGTLYRVFNNGSFKQGGRFYGADYQNIPKALRSQIILNGSPVVEYDYKAYHFNMMYNLIGQEVLSDPYSLPGLPKDLRDLLKKISNIIINAKSYPQAAGAIKHQIFNIEPGCKDEEERQIQRELVRGLGLDEHKLIGAIKEHHADLKDFFHSGMGVHLQFKDSQIAKRIFEHFASQDIPELCMHDSFLVTEEDGDELQYLMREYYRDMFGYDCPVDKK